jgi:hypothetical protein
MGADASPPAELPAADEASFEGSVAVPHPTAVKIRENRRTRELFFIKVIPNPRNNHH